MSGAISTCFDKCKPSKAEIQEFELSSDYKKLPNSKPLKCYIHCLFVEYRLFNTTTNEVDLTDFINFLSQLSEKEQNIYLKMGKGCAKKVRRIKDPIEKIYQGQICLKENDNDVRKKLDININ